MSKWVYAFGGGEGETEGDAGMKSLLGGKGANLAEMANLKLPVPPGFTITTEVCTWFYHHDRSYPKELKAQAADALRMLEEKMGLTFGDPARPLLVSVRSGAPVSMPGMMDTVLNLGLNEETVAGLARLAGDERFAWDSYRRFIQMYGDVVMGVQGFEFEEILERYKDTFKILRDADVSAEGWKEIVYEYKQLVKDVSGMDFPTDPQAQLWGAIHAVFDSWMTPRAATYRMIHDISPDLGTAVNVQAMVFGNRGDDCGTGVAFTRDPATGENIFYGEYLINAQGEDVVAGTRTPQPISELAEEMPQAYAELLDVRQKLEQHFRDVQDIEFTIQQNKLYMLQTRAAKRTAAAALKVAVALVEEGMITRDEALLRLEPQQLDQLLHPTLDPKADKTVIGKGLEASPGAACGEIVFTADDAEAKAKDGKAVILCRIETSPEDIHGMHAAKGILTARGGMTSHAAVVARGMGKPCVSGAGSLIIDLKEKVMRVGDFVLNEGDIITIDGSTGLVYYGKVPVVATELSDDFETVMRWADERRRMKVRTNAETPKDAQMAILFGAEGIGLCRTEHMFFDPSRIRRVREMILATDDQTRAEALAHLLPEQRQDFIELFRIMDGLPVTIRLLDPPLHEFLPHGTHDMEEFAKETGLEFKHIRTRVQDLHEFNPMLGHRGCRLGLTFPAIYEMQVRAIFEAALSVQKEGVTVHPEVMIPLAATAQELDILKEKIELVAQEIFEEQGSSVAYIIGTMIELPRAALCADELAQHAAFFSFGTNDLTQTALGLSRDDSGHFMPAYLEQGVFERDPFATLDIDGVGKLVEIAVEKGSSVNPGIKLGVCGEHGGDPASIRFFDRVGLDYVSCSPYRVPIARLSAAQASIRARLAEEAHPPSVSKRIAAV
ncbi:MAG: pyruvate, phosphate dikinase [Rhodospirillales bacterium]|nr:pyruvate, phosphate dikinase [Rhodospirillales bacterium]MCB9979570.1 pyruvate, phosphate dikinase [Rhodospirillales bacterium]